MSNSVDNRVVQMEFDNKKFEKGVKTTLGSLDKLNRSLKLDESAKGLERLQRTADDFNLSSVGNAADQAGMHFTAMQVVAFTALQRITNAAFDAGKKILSALTVDMPKAGFGKYEESINAVQTIMFATGKSIGEVQKVLDRLLKYTDETRYSRCYYGHGGNGQGNQKNESGRKVHGKERPEYIQIKNPFAKRGRRKGGC